MMAPVMSSSVSMRSSDPDWAAASSFSRKRAAADLSPPLPPCRFASFKAHVISDTRASLCPWDTVVQALPASTSSHCLPTIIDGSRQVKTLTADSGSCSRSIHCDASAARLTVVTKADTSYARTWCSMMVNTSLRTYKSTVPGVPLRQSRSISFNRLNAVVVAGRHKRRR